LKLNIIFVETLKTNNMNKKLLLALTATSLLFTANLKAQEQEAFGKGKIVVTAGYGVPNLSSLGARLLYSTDDAGNSTGFKVSSTGPIIIKAEYGIIKRLGVGVAFGYSGYNANWNFQDQNGIYNPVTNSTTYNTYTENLKQSNISFGVHGNFHIVTKEKFDMYAGLGLGLALVTKTYSNNDPYNGTAYTASLDLLGTIPIYFSITYGVRYYFIPNVGIYAEVGWEKYSIAQGGLAIKF
jgi:hypothetical protein